MAGLAVVWGRGSAVDAATPRSALLHHLALATLLLRHPGPHTPQASATSASARYATGTHGAHGAPRSARKVHKNRSIVLPGWTHWTHTHKHAHTARYFTHPAGTIDRLQITAVLSTLISSGRSAFFCSLPLSLHILAYIHRLDSYISSCKQGV